MADRQQRLREEAARWFARMRDAEPDHPLRGRFEAWLLADPAHASEYAAYADTWADFDSPSRLQTLARALERRRAGLRERRARLGKALAGSIVGSLIMLGSGLFGFEIWRERAAQPVLEMARSTGVGEIGQQALSDGTRLTLNADTQVDIVYYRDRRVVKLKRGEAIFEVARDASRPFIVDSGHARVTVLGTRFAVNRLSSLVRVSVDHGRVQVDAQGGAGSLQSAPLILGAGEVAEVLAGGTPRHSPRKAGDAFAFQGGMVVFEQAGLVEIAETLSRYRHAPVVTLHHGAEPRVTAVLQSSDVEKFLNMLPRVAPVQVQDVGGEIRLIPRH